MQIKRSTKIALTALALFLISSSFNYIEYKKKEETTNKHSYTNTNSKKSKSMNTLLKKEDTGIKKTYKPVIENLLMI